MARCVNYGANDKAPLGWPHFLSVHQSMTLSGLLSLYVQNRYYSQGTVTYEGGSILLNQGGQIAVIKSPQFSLRNSSTGAILSMDMTSLRGTGFSVSGSGSSNLLSTYFSNQSQKYFQYRGLNMINNISLSVTSPEISGWLQMLAPYLPHLQNVTSNPSVADIGSGCNLNTYVTWGAYSLTVSGNTLHLTIFNIASLILETGTMSITDCPGDPLSVSGNMFASEHAIKQTTSDRLFKNATFFSTLHRFPCPRVLFPWRKVPCVLHPLRRSASACVPPPFLISALRYPSR